MQRNRLKGSGGREERGTEKEKAGRKRADLPVCAFLSLCPRGCTDRQLSPLKLRGLHPSCQALGIPVVHAETLGEVWLEGAPPRSGSFPAGYIGKLVLLLNGKAREILAKH